MRRGDNNISLAPRFSPACACTTGGAAVRTPGETALTQMQVNRMKVFYGVTNGQAGLVRHARRETTVFHGIVAPKVCIGIIVYC